MGNGWVDGVLGDIAFDSLIVVGAAIVGVAIFGQRPTLHFHFVGGLPGA